MIELDELKRYLRVVHDDDDQLLQELLDSALQEAAAYLGATSLEVAWDSSSTSVVPEDVLLAIKLLVRADYEAADPSHAAAWRRVAETKMYPYRQSIGV